MLTDKEMIGLQAERHDLISTQSFPSIEEYVLHRIHIAGYLQASHLAKDKCVLDVGCNTGYGTALLSESAHTVIGVDVSEKAIANARKWFGRPGIKFQAIDGQRLPFPDNTFDFVVSMQVIEHLVDYDRFLSEIQRVLKTSGMAVFSTPNAALRLDDGMRPWNPFHAREFKHHELKELLNSYFLQVSILGLSVNEPFYSIETTRVSQAREKARRKADDMFPLRSAAMRETIMSMLPFPVQVVLRNIRSHLARTVKLVETFREKYGNGDFSYRDHDLDSALDFLAICTNDERSRMTIEHILNSTQLENTTEERKE